MRKLTLALLIGAGIFLSIRAFHPKRWSAWGFSDAQVLMSSQYYAKEGFLSTRFLLVPMGYSNVGRLLDDPPVRHLARGTYGDHSGLGPRRLYTHYPNWWTVPYGILAKFGAQNPAWYRLFSILLSLIAVWFLYLFCERHWDSTVGLLACTAYIATESFLAYCDAISTMPFDDITRLAFIYLWSLERKRTHLFLCTFVYLLACMSGLDSICFLFAWAVLYDLLYRRRSDWKAWFTLSCTPFLFFGFSLVQNSLYLGLREAVADWWGYLHAYSGGKMNFISNLNYRLYAAYSLVTRTFNIPYLSAIYLFMIVAIYTCAREFRQSNWLIPILIICGSLFPFLIPSKGLNMSYEIRQHAPLLAIVVALFSHGVTRILARWSYFRPVFGTLVILLTFCWSYGTLANFQRVVDYPPKVSVAPPLDEYLAKLRTRYPGDKVIFHLGKVFPFWTQGEFPGVDSITEYLSGGLVLAFSSGEKLVEAMDYLWNNRIEDFTPLIVYRESEYSTAQLHSDLGASRFVQTYDAVDLGNFATTLELKLGSTSLARNF